MVLHFRKFQLKLDGFTLLLKDILYQKGYSYLSIHLPQEILFL